MLLISWGEFNIGPAGDTGFRKEIIFWLKLSDSHFTSPFNSSFSTITVITKRVNIVSVLLLSLWFMVFGLSSELEFSVFIKPSRIRRPLRSICEPLTRLWVSLGCDATTL